MTKGLKANFPMSSRNVIIVCSCMVVLVCTAIVLGGRVLVRSFDQIETGLGIDLINRLYGGLDRELNRFVFVVRNHAHIEEVQRAIRNGNASWLSARFSEKPFIDLNVELIWIYDHERGDLLTLQFDHKTRKFKPSVSPVLLDILRPYLDESAATSKPAVQHIVRSPQGLLAFAVSPIVEENGKPKVTLLMARLLASETLQRIRDLKTSPIELFVANDDGRIEGLPARFSYWMANTPAGSGDILVLYSGDKFAHMYRLMRDSKDVPVAVLTTHMERQIGHLGRRVTWTLMAIITLFVVLGGGICLLLFERLRASWLAHSAVKQRYEKIIAHLDETIALVERDTGRIVEANAALLLGLGYTSEELRGLMLGELYVDLPPFEQMLDGAGRRATRECRMRHRDGHFIDVEITITAVTDDGKELICVVGRDITERRQAEQQAVDNRRKLSRLANHDSLTGLPNRLFLQSRLPRLLRKLSDNNRLLALYYVDVDHFKNINDSRGHASGDQLLRVFAKRLKAATGAHDMVVRMGGDEFVVIASLLPNAAAADSIAARLVATAQAPIILDETTVSVSASIGISIYPNDGIDAETLLKHADIALYQAKENGRNGYKRFTADMNIEVGEQVALEQALRHALGTEQLFVEYQPVVNLATERLESFEALVRWRHPEFGYVSPVRFIPIAERCGVIDILGAEVLRKVFAQLAQWQAEGVPLAPIAVNVSPLQLQRTTLSTLVQELSLEFDVDPRWVHFEITESAVLLRNTELIVTLETLRALGSKISIDDFGTGFSNLSYLKHLPVDTIKIDRAFVRDVAMDAGDAAIIASICAIARELRLRVVAEGIETHDQLIKLRELGSVYGQGFYFSKPAPAYLCREMLEKLAEEQQPRELRRALVG